MGLQDILQTSMITKQLHLLIIVSTILVASCLNKGDGSLKIGNPYEGRIDSTSGILRNSGSLDIASYVTLGNVTYGFCKSKENVVNYIFCKDTKFITDGIKIGDSYDKLKRVFDVSSVEIERGWALYVELPSGWCAAFGLPDEGMNEARIDDSATVKWFFKR